MRGPFPGMDPWLENPVLWPGVHQRLITYIADALQPLLGRRYVAAVEERVYVSTTDRMIVPDVSLQQRPSSHSASSPVAVVEPDEAVVVEHAQDEVRESFLQIVDLQANEEIVTVLEVLSPSNKEHGEGRELYAAKQGEILQSSANLVEIDLLRCGPHVVSISAADALRAGQYDYLVAVSRARDRDKRSLFYSRTVRDRLPRIAVPLRVEDRDVTLDLQPLMERIYDGGRYADRIDYAKPCVPRLRPDDEAWAHERIRNWQITRTA